MNDTCCQELGQKTGGYTIQTSIVVKSYLREAVSIWKIRWKIGEIQRAIQDLSKALEINPNINAAYEIYCHRAQCFLAVHEYTKALPDLDRALQLNSAYAKAYC